MTTEVKTPDGNQEAVAPPIELLEMAVVEMMNSGNTGPAYWESTLRDFRKALDAARHENVWDVVQMAFEEIVGVSFEMLIRSMTVLRRRMAVLEHNKGAREFTPVGAEAERVERVAHFMLETAERFAKVRHVTHLARRKDDPKIVDLESAREKVASGDAKKKRKKKAKAADA